MSDDIRPGDVVVCVDDRPCLCCGLELPVRRGAYYTVETVRPGHNRILGLGIWCELKGVPQNVPGHIGWGISSVRLRKIDAPRTELSERIRACKPMRVTA